MMKVEKEAKLIKKKKREQNEAASTYHHQALLMPSQAWPNDSSAF